MKFITSKQRSSLTAAEFAVSPGAGARLAGVGGALPGAAATVDSPPVLPSPPDPVQPPEPPETPTPVDIDTELGISPQEEVTRIQLKSALTVDDYQIVDGVVGTSRADLLTGTDLSEVIAGGGAKDDLVGNGGQDVFLFNTPGQFGLELADLIRDFKREPGEKIGLARDAFPGVSAVRFLAVKGAKRLKRASKTSNNFIYERTSGSLYFNSNGTKAGFGDGGVFAILQGAPQLVRPDLQLL